MYAAKVVGIKEEKVDTQLVFIRNAESAHESDGSFGLGNFEFLLALTCFSAWLTGLGRRAEPPAQSPAQSPPYRAFPRCLLPLTPWEDKRLTNCDGALRNRTTSTQTR